MGGMNRILYKKLLFGKGCVILQPQKNVLKLTNLLV
jgi:hypothetical protein